MVDFLGLRQKMIDCQLRTNDVTDYDVLDAFAGVPRERFIAPERSVLAYVDEDVPVAAKPAPRYLMRPATFAKILQLALIDADEKVLVIGSASGYETAVVAKLAREVVSLESDASLSAAAAERLQSLDIGNVTSVVGPLSAGWSAAAPYDVIVVVGAVEAGTEALASQLALDGRMVLVEGVGGAGEARLYRRSAGGVSARFAFNAAAHLLPGFERPKAFVF